MKCTNKRILGFIILPILILQITGCSSVSYQLPYDTNATNTAFRFSSVANNSVATSFSNDLCVTDVDIPDRKSVV